MSATLFELFSGIPDHNLTAADYDVVIRAIATDSRQVQPRDLFVAMAGQHTDGHFYIHEAIERGASAILATQLPTTPVTVPWITSANPRRLLPELAARLYHHPAREMTLHAVSGTNGKTSTVYMLAHILTRLGLRVAFWTTNSVEGIARPFRPQMTTPDPASLHHFLREAADRGAQHAIIEVSSHALQLGRITGLQFETAALTNISPDHLDFHGTFEAYMQAKASLFQYLAPGGGVALNIDDPHIRSLAPPSPQQIIWYGLNPQANVHAQIEGWGPHHIVWQLFYRQRPVATIRLPVTGQHNVMNALAAVTMALHLGCDPATAGLLLEDFVPPARRLETIEVRGYTIVSDVAMNRASYAAVMQSVAAMHKPIVVVTAIRGNRGTLVNRDIADVLADWNQWLHFEPVLVTLSDSYVNQLPVDYRVRTEEQQAFMDTAQRRHLSAVLFAELPEALDAALLRLRPGGVLLLLGTFGMDDGLLLARNRLSRAD